MSRRIVLIGASGMFGARMARRIAAWPDVELVLAGRTEAPLAALRAELRAGGAAAKIAIAVLDRERPSAVLALSPWAVVDAAGPFQGAGYDLAAQVIDAGAHWVDLADARSYVAGFARRLDGPARARNVVAVTGASSTPALTHAALDRITARWRRIDKVMGAISPAAQLPGLSVVRAILSWTGRPVACFTGGAWTERPGWSGMQRVRIPGVGRRRVGLADVPDLDLLPRRATQEALFYAGVEPPILQWLLWLISLPVRWRLSPGLRPLSRPLRALARPFIPLGALRGGMVVTAEGIDADGSPALARWSLAALGHDGQAVPASAAVATLRAILAGRLERGARVCVGLVSLDDILAEVSGLAITTRAEAWKLDAAGVFPAVLGAAFDTLPEVVRQVHGGDGHPLTGRAVSGARGWVGWMAGLAGLPRRGRYEAEVEIAPRKRGGEIWRRRFGRHRFASRLSKVKGEPGMFQEALGPIGFRFSAEVDARGFRWRQEGWRLGPIPMPNWLGPKVRGRSYARDGVYRFSVVVAHPWLGVIAAYCGRLNVNAL